MKAWHLYFIIQLMFLCFSVPEILDRKHFHEEGVCVYYTKFKRPPQVNEKWCKNSLLLFNSEKKSVFLWVLDWFFVWNTDLGLCFCNWTLSLCELDFLFLFLKVLWHWRNLQKMFPCSLCCFLPLLLLMSLIRLQWGGCEKEISEVRKSHSDILYWNLKTSIVSVGWGVKINLTV